MTSDGLTPTSRRSRLPFVAIPVLAIIALMGWAFASPIGSAPDDDFHLASIWCGSGTPDAECQPGDSADERRISPELIKDSVCYANNSGKNASCQGSDFGDDLTTGLKRTDRGNFDGLYPPVYYFVMSAFAGSNLQISALAMRLATSILFIGLVTALFFLLPVRRRPTLLTSIVVTLVPLGMFLIPSNNPSGWAIISAGTLWIALLGFFETTGKRRIALGALAAVSTVVGAGARADSAIYAVIAIAVVVLMTARRTRGYLLLALLPVALAVIAVLWFFSAQQSSAASDGLTPTGGEPAYSKYVLLVQNLLQSPGLVIGVFGSWPLGWLDTPLPAIVSFGAFGVFAAVVVIGFGTPYRRKAIAGAALLFAVLAVPTLILYRSGTIVGAQVQPRYILPLVIVFAGISLMQPAGRALLASRAQVMIVASGLTVANTVALHENIRRYVSGTRTTAGNLDSGAQWWWHIPVSPMGMWSIGSIAFALTVFWLGGIWLAHQARLADSLRPIDPPVTERRFARIR